MIKQKNMRLLLTFIIFILGGFYTFGNNNCCEQCCEYLGIFCNKGKEEEEKKEKNKEEEEKEGEENNGKGKKEEDKNEEEKKLEKFCLKKNEEANLEEIKKLISTDWYDNKVEETSFILYEKIDDTGNQDLNKDDRIKVKKDKNGFSVEGNFIPEKDNNEEKWALFEIIYKKEEKKEGEGEKNDEENEKENKENETKYLYCSNIESDKINGIFESCKQHISISVIACNTSNVTDMRYMFSECNSLTKLNLSSFDTNSVTDMSCMFCDCSSLQTLDLSNFNTSNVTDMGGMFSNCTFLQTLDLKNFDTNKVTDMRCMFYECTSLKTLDLPNSKISKNTEIVDMFDSCNALHTVIFNEEQQVDKKNLPDNNVPQDKVNLQEIIENQLKKLGQWDKQEEENKITFGKKPQT